MKVSASVLEQEKEMRNRVVSEPIVKTAGTPISVIDRSANDLVCMGIEARGKGELSKSAYYFMKAAEAGNSTGKIYWGKSTVSFVLMPLTDLQSRSRLKIWLGSRNR